MGIKKYISTSINKFKNDAFATASYDLIKYLIILAVATSSFSIIGIWWGFLKFLFLPISIPVFVLILVLLFSIILTVVILNIRFKNKYQELKTDNHTDELTGLKNHKALKEELTVSISESNNHPLSLVLIDIDNFKEFNKKTSHVTADILLKKLGELLASDKRVTDQTYRYNQAGDEFMIVAQSTNLSQAKIASERKRELIENNVFEVDGEFYNITVSCGYVELNPSEDYVALTKRVSKAMTQAKESGKNCSKSLN